MDLNEQRQLAQDVYEFFCGHYVPTDEVGSADVLFVFGRDVSDLAYVAANLYLDGFVQKVLVTGGVGKDSGGLPKLGLTEASYLAALMYNEGVAAEDLLIESKATNGGENSRFGTNSIVEAGIPAANIILLTHPSNGLRVLAAHKLEARKMGFEAIYQLTTCSWKEWKTGGSDEPALQALVISECVRLIKWPLRTVGGVSDPWADPTDVPAELVTRVLAWDAMQPK